MKNKNKSKYFITLLITIGIVLGVSGTAVITSVYIFGSKHYSSGAEYNGYDDNDDDEHRYTKKREFGFSRNRFNYNVLSTLFEGSTGLEVASDMLTILNFIDTNNNGKIEELDGDEVFKKMDINNDNKLDSEEVIISFEKLGINNVAKAIRTSKSQGNISFNLWQIGWKILASKSVLNMFFYNK